MPDTDAESGRLRLLHWNIHSWRDEAGASNVEGVTNLIREMRPHVVSLVEVDEEWNEPSTLDALAERCGYISIFPSTFEYGNDEPRGGFGNALLTTLPILSVRQRQLVWPVVTYDRTEPSEPRSVILAKVGFHGQPLWIGSTHLPRADEHMRNQALRRLKSVVRELEEPWILCGDFNTPAAEWLEPGGELRAWPDPPVATYPTDEPTEAIDYCVTGRSLMIDVRVLDVQGSDHRAVEIHCISDDRR